MSKQQQQPLLEYLEATKKIIEGKVDAIDRVYDTGDLVEIIEQIAQKVIQMRKEIEEERFAWEMNAMEVARQQGPRDEQEKADGRADGLTFALELIGEEPKKKKQ